MIMRTGATNRRGITLTEILIAIMIMGIGLVSLATLFPIGLLRIREAQRQSRSAYLAESVAADVAARGLLKTNSFAYADLVNVFPPFAFNRWYYSANMNAGLGGYYDPLVQDTPGYGLDAFNLIPGPPPSSVPAGASAGILSGGYGLPFAYDPLWRWQTDYHNGGIYLFDTGNPNYPPPGGTPEARFADGQLMRIAGDYDGNGPPSAYGLQRLTNFNRPAYVDMTNTYHPAVMPAANQVPSIFVSPEDIVLQESTNSTSYTYGGAAGGTPINTPPSPIVPDLNTSPGQVANDWRFTWMITAQQNNSSNGASFDGNIVIFESRQFGLDLIVSGIDTVTQAAGENVYEAVFGYSKNVIPFGALTVGYGAGADRTVLIRWDASLQPDPVVKVGDWIADVTYERQESMVYTRFSYPSGTVPLSGVPNMLNNLEWDNLPAQRCYWYQVQKVNPAQPDAALGLPYRSMVVTVNRKLEARTLLHTAAPNGPVYKNAVLVCPSIVNVIPQTFFVR
jgi:type II secretory pathway pseudopilin PulG